MEPLFLLLYYTGIQPSEYFKLPIVYIRWLINRTNKEILEARKQQTSIPDKSPHNNTDEIRSLTGHYRTAGNHSARMHRF